MQGRRRRRRTRRPRDLIVHRFVVRAAAVAAALLPATATAQSPTPSVTLPPVVVIAQKEPADLQRLPLSATGVLEDTIRGAGMRIAADAALLAPNVHFTQFSARKLSTVRVRGIGSSPANPGVTTFIDGVPQLNDNTSSLDLLNVERIEFVRGPQSALFGRNTVGGLVNVVTGRPSLEQWSGSFVAPFGNYGSSDIQGTAGGPLGDRVAVGFSIGHRERDGFTTNAMTGRDLDRRSGTAFKAQALFVPSADWEARVIVSGERARDGDYALNDLGSLRRSPFQAARDFEGRADRDVLSTTVLVRREGRRVTLSSTTGVVSWQTADLTDLDYTPLPLITRQNEEEATQFTQEVRLASAASAPVRLSDAAALRWQAGVFFFTQNYDQQAVNNFSPFVLSPFVSFPVAQTSPQTALEDVGIGAYGQGTLTVADDFDVTLGARVDREQKDARLDTFFTPAIGSPSSVVADRSFSSVSPQVAVAYRLQPRQTLYATVGRGFKAGGFNPASPAGSESYGEEHALNIEGGVKTTWADGRVTANASVFVIDWDDLQLNLPDLSVPGQFYIANVGAARSSGVEFELNARAHAKVDVFGTLGYTRARFGDGTTSSGADVSGNDIPNTPEYTASLGAQVNHALTTAVAVYGRGEVGFSGAFRYDDLNREGQDAFSLANFRAGVRGRYVFGEVWVRNAFDTRYIPVAFAYGQLAPSGFIGEMGAPRTFGVSGGVTF
jgi:iron complex outermembrane receptor protein